MDFDHPAQISAAFLMSAAREKFAAPEGGAADDRCILMFDLYIKARSFSLINKVFFWLSLLAGICVLAWPAFSVVAASAGSEGVTLLESTVVQTSVTALAALCFAVYSHYKKRQAAVETLMRTVLLSGRSADELLPEVVEELQRLDMGFAFKPATGRGK
ncbi:hypothetical protein ACQ5SO_00805 [Rhodovulum sp. DZ06]|uniref:hypothetical protein n=1 Tax=Rhodovulum sp. DZ06 TaxID=3425126 RepID=UPI003D32BC1B